MKVHGQGGGVARGEREEHLDSLDLSERSSEASSARSGSSEPYSIFDRSSIIALSLYGVLSIICFGHALIFDYSDHYVGRGPDPSAFIWSITWWHYAISHRLNPLLTHVVFTPDGKNLTWMTTIPLACLLVWPITSAYGPVVAYNCLALLAPTAAGWATFILCRYLTKAFWPALLGGYIFGFSSYFLSQTAGGHLDLVLVFPVPIALYLVVRWFDGSIGFRKMAIFTSLTLAVQYFLYVEVFTTMTIFAALALFLAFGATTGALNRRVLKLTEVLAYGYGIALLLMSPFIYYLLAYGHPHGELWDTQQFSADLLNYVIPTNVSALGTLGPLLKVSTTFPGNIFERTAYIGPVLISLAAVYAYRHWKEPLGKVLIDSLVVICVLSVGPTLHFGGRELFEMPGKLFGVMPVIDKALPVRFTMYAVLIIAMITALWFASSVASVTTKFIVAIMIVVFALPNLAAHDGITKVNTPPFFAHGLYKKYINRGENVVVAPYWLLGNSMLWQAQTDMYFRMAGGWTGPLPDEYRRWPLVNALTEWTALPDPQMQAMSFLAKHEVGAIVVSDDDPDKALWRRWVPAAAATPIEIGGVTLYQLPPETLLRYRAITAEDAERRADTALFDQLLMAAAKYQAEGRDPELLTPFVAERLGLIPPDWLPGPIWTPEWFAGTKFDMTLDTDKAMYRNVWLGYVDKIFVGVGIKGTYEGLKPIIDRYRSDAYRIYFPFPQKFATGTHDGDRGLLLLFFKADGLKRAIPSSAQLTPDGL